MRHITLVAPFPRNPAFTAPIAQENCLEVGAITHRPRLIYLVNWRLSLRIVGDSAMRNVGLWIDLQKAVIVSDTGRGVDIQLVNSDIDHCRWQYDVWALPAPVRQQMSLSQFGRFYQNVSDRVADARSIHILGPCDAKCELEKQLQSDQFNGPISVESAGRMTDSQIVNAVRMRFKGIGSSRSQLGHPLVSSLMR